MFSQPIVFVVGAGASAEFGLPAGGDMKQRIAKSLNDVKTDDQNFFGIVDVRFAKYREAATALATRIGEFESIDEALHWFSAQPEVVSLGKAAIVHEILRSERNCSLFNEVTPEMIPQEKSYDQTWVQHFLSMCMGSHTKEQAKIAFKNVTLLNFNYDRTVEHFLFSRLQTSFGLTQPEAVEAIAHLSIVRPYGTVGSLPWQGKSAVPFGDQVLDHDRLFALSQNVRTYTEQNLSAGLTSEIRYAIDKARIVVFLEFGFHQQNMSLLNGSAPGYRRVLATVLTIEPENFEAMKAMISNTLRCLGPEQIQLLGRYAHQMLPLMRPSLMALL